MIMVYFSQVGCGSEGLDSQGNKKQLGKKLSVSVHVVFWSLYCHFIAWGLRPSHSTRGVYR